jgi:hypothetical protein
MGSAHGGPPSPLRAMTGDSAEELHTASDGEGRIDLPSPRTSGMGASPTPATTISWPESTPIAQAIATILPRQPTPRSNTDLPIERQRAHQVGKRAQAHAQPPSIE